MKKVVFANNYGYYTTDDTNFETRLVSVYNPSRISFKDVRTDKNGKRYALCEVEPVTADDGTIKYYRIVESKDAE